jgi:hypothetical protein
MLRKSLVGHFAHLIDAFGNCLETISACQWARCNSQHLNLLGRVKVYLSYSFKNYPCGWPSLL